VTVRTLVLLFAAGLLCSCRSPEAPTPAGETWQSEIRDGTQKVASATVRGAEVVRESVDTAYHGVKNGYAEPENQAYGAYPRDYVRAVEKHMRRFEGVDESASFEFGKPVRAYYTKGLLRGGAVDWQGWVVDVEIETRTLFGQPRVVPYVVRMKDGEILEVLEKAHAGALIRVSEAPVSVPAAPRR
jgi:hypothetical protein